MTSASNFDKGIDNWLQALNEPWNRLRYKVYSANLARHMKPGSLQILDVGGGSGSDAIPLALQGHRVTLVDYSEKMLNEAIRQAQIHGVEDRITFHHAEVKALPHLFSTPLFDVVLCHNVIQYITDMPDVLKIITQPLKQAGIISIISINRYSESLQAATLRRDLDEAYSKLDVRETYTPVFDTPVKRFSGEEVIQALTEAGSELLGHYGVRCVMDYIHGNELKDDPAFYSKLERLELAMSDKYPYYLLARFFQIVAQKI